MLSSPVVGDDGTIYAGVVQNVRDRNPRGVLVAINSTSHQVKWQYQANGPIECTPVLGDDGVIYFGDNNGTVHALDPGGKSLWTAQLSAPVRSAGTLTHDGLLAFCLDDGSLVALSCSSRQLASQGWPKLLGGRGQSGLVGGPP
jgi:outer membrane protein assembly factor BamB